MVGDRKEEREGTVEGRKEGTNINPTFLFFPGS